MNLADLCGFFRLLSLFMAISLDFLALHGTFPHFRVSAKGIVPEA
jgi:hypothetical protein